MIAAVQRRFQAITDPQVMRILLAFFAGAVVTSLGARILTIITFERPLYEWAVSLLDWADGFFQNFGTEMFGAFLTFLLIEIFVGQRRDLQRLKRELRSRVNDTARSAAEELRELGWLTDGTLQGVVLSGANLREAALHNANLRRATIWNGKFQKADLLGANLHGASLESTDLQGANLQQANLQEADLQYVNLRDADLWTTNLDGADLRHADLRRARATVVGQLRRARTLANVTLPDGARLPDDEDEWQAAFDAWVQTATIDPFGYILFEPRDDDESETEG